MHRVWKQVAKSHQGKFNKELNIKTYFAHLDNSFACFISFIIYSYKYLIISFLLKCMRQKQGTNLCTYYVCENIHGLVGPLKGWIDWEEEVSKKLVNI